MNIGGTELNALRLAERLNQDRFHLSVACLRDDGPLLERYHAAGIHVERFAIQSLVGLSAVREGIRFKVFLTRERVDVVHTHDRYMNAFAVPWARLAGVPTVIASKRWNSISTPHRILNRLAYRFSHGVLANSSRVAAGLTREDGVPERRIIAISNFVDDDAFVVPSAEWLRRTRARIGISPESMVIGIVANLRAVKNHALLIRAFAELSRERPDLVLALVGSGEEEHTLRKIVSQLGIGEHVVFAGTMPNLPNLHYLFDLSVLTSHSEGFPNSLVEAMAAGRPVVATDVGGVSDAVENGFTGFLVPPGDCHALAGAMRRLLDDPSLRETMGARGRQRARDRFSASSIIPLIEDIYSEGLRR